MARTVRLSLLARLAVALCVLTGISAGARAGDWPMFAHDSHGSSVTSERLRPPLKEAWRFQPVQPPCPAWPAPAKSDLWHHIPELSPRVTYDRAFHVAAVGDTVYFGSSGDDQIRALDAADGKLRWTFFANGPIRLAPTYWEGKLYVSSDDGHVHCLDAATGTEKWRFRATEDSRHILGNGRMISPCPVRTSVLVEQGTAYFCAGLFPLEGVFLCALDAATGAPRWKAPCDMSPQGYLLASDERLYCPQGRIAPRVFARNNGSPLPSPEVGGGTFALLTGESLIYGPGSAGEFPVVSPGKGDRIASFSGNHLIVHQGVAYLQAEDYIAAVDRQAYISLEQSNTALAKRLDEMQRSQPQDEEAAAEWKGELAKTRLALREGIEARKTCHLWKEPSGRCYSMILAGDMLFAGSECDVTGYRADDGKVRWSEKVDGRVYGLAAANGRLFVSTDTGSIYCFIHKRWGSARAGKDTPKPTLPSTEPWERILPGITVPDKGYCLALGEKAWPAVLKLAAETVVKTVWLVDGPEAVRQARGRAAGLGLYGGPVTVHAYPRERGRLPYPDCFANLIVAPAGAPSLPKEEIERLLRPWEGVAWLGTAQAASGASPRRAPKLVTRGPLPGARSWTHMYGEPGNSACSGDEYLTWPLRVQWFGQPGPREMVDRHHRNVAPVSMKGRVFAPGDNRLMAIDAYNGTLLWNVEIRDSRRLGAPFDCNNLVAAEDEVLLAVKDTCQVRDQATGSLVGEYAMPQLVDSAERFWGYTAVADGLLLGSGRRPEAVYSTISWQADRYQWGDYRRLVTSDYLFALERGTKNVAWTYQHGVIINPAIAIGDGRAYFIESELPEVPTESDGMLEARELLASEAAITAIDLRTGEVMWRVGADLRRFEQIVFLSYSDGVVVVTGSFDKGPDLWHVLHAFDAETGKALWQRERATHWPVGGRHGEQHRHPAIVDGVVFAEPHAYDLKTGEDARDWAIPRRRGCGTLSASARHLFFRDANPTALDTVKGAMLPLNRVNRPGCWVNIIPAEGMVVIPESSSGCTCGYPLQTSFAYAPYRQ